MRLACNLATWHASCAVQSNLQLTIDVCCRHVESSFFRHWAEKHDAQLYNPRLHQQRMIFPAPWRMEQQQ